MKEMKITIKTGNAAFENLEAELGRILRDLADRLEAYDSPESLRDINGNNVGSVWVDTWIHKEEDYS